MSKDGDKSPTQVRTDAHGKKASAADTTDDDDDDVILHPGPHDVLMGRGAPSTDYSGNLRFRELVKERRSDYVNARRRKDKQGVAGEIIATIKIRGGRFLERIETYRKTNDAGECKKQTIWQPVEDRKSLLVKVKQLMRDVGPAAQEKRNLRREMRRQQELEAITKGSGFGKKSSDAMQQIMNHSGSPSPMYDSSMDSSRGPPLSFLFGQRQQTSALFLPENFRSTGGAAFGIDTALGGGNPRTCLSSNGAGGDYLLGNRFQQDMNRREVALLRQQFQQQQQQAAETEALLRYSQQQNIMGGGASQAMGGFSGQGSLDMAALRREQLIRRLHQQHSESFPQGIPSQINRMHPYQSSSMNPASTDGLYAALLNQHSGRSATDSEASSRRF